MTDISESNSHSDPAWFDEANALEQIDARVAQAEHLQSGIDYRSLLTGFITDGFCVLPGAIPEILIDSIMADFHTAAQKREQILLRMGGKYNHPGEWGIVGRRKRVIDFYVPSHSALEAILAKPVTDFLSLIYDEPPLAFQSLLFQYGSQQAMHQDTAYVVTDSPPLLTASWIALEDVQAGSGELCYYKGSHRNIEVLFDTGRAIWSRDIDDSTVNESYINRLSRACEDANLELQTFLPKKGDILFWHAGLVHGGSEITSKDYTRKSLVTHYCPHSGKPNYFNIQKETSSKEPFAEGFYSSRHYDVRPESNNPYPIYTGGEDISIK